MRCSKPPFVRWPLLGTRELERVVECLELRQVLNQPAHAKLAALRESLVFQMERLLSPEVRVPRHVHRTTLGQTKRLVFVLHHGVLELNLGAG